MSLPLGRIVKGDALDVLAGLPAEAFNCVVTSPPYWMQRVYGHEGELGLEPTVAEYIERLVRIFAEVRRVLTPAGTCWLNLGDTYITRGHTLKTMGLSSKTSLRQKGMNSPADNPKRKALSEMAIPAPRPHAGLKPKDKALVPHRAAIALQDDGWYVRQDVVWHKRNPLPESVTDRPTTAHEFVFLLTKSQRAYYDVDAVLEPTTGGAHDRGQGVGPKAAATKTDGPRTLRPRYNEEFARAVNAVSETRRRRSVWSLSSQPYSGAHFAVMPRELASICIRAGCPRGGVVLDLFAGAGTTGVAAYELGREFVGIDLAGGDADLGGHTAHDRLNAARRGQSLQDHMAGQLTIEGVAHV